MTAATLEECISWYGERHGKAIHKYWEDQGKIAGENLNAFIERSRECRHMQAKEQREVLAKTQKGRIKRFFRKHYIHIVRKHRIVYFRWNDRQWQLHFPVFRSPVYFGLESRPAPKWYLNMTGSHAGRERLFKAAKSFFDEGVVTEPFLMDRFADGGTMDYKPGARF